MQPIVHASARQIFMTIQTTRWWSITKHFQMSLKSLLVKLHGIFVNYWSFSRIWVKFCRSCDYFWTKRVVPFESARQAGSNAPVHHPHFKKKKLPVGAYITTRAIVSFTAISGQNSYPPYMAPSNRQLWKLKVQSSFYCRVNTVI